MYCAKGTINHSFGLQAKKTVLNQFQTGIFSSFAHMDTSLFFEKEEEIRLSNIIVTTQIATTNEENPDQLRSQLFKTFMPRYGTETFAYTGSYNLKIAERVQQLENISQKGLVRSLY